MLGFSLGRKRRQQRQLLTMDKKRAAFYRSCSDWRLKQGASKQYALRAI